MVFCPLAGLAKEWYSTNRYQSVGGTPTRLAAPTAALHANFQPVRHHRHSSLVLVVGIRCVSGVAKGGGGIE
jgi:hypothetical protein